MRRAPDFWFRRRSWEATLLAPFGVVYGVVAQGRMRPDATPPVPALQIGNFTIGGAGKTPTAAYVCRIARDAGFKPAILMRGFGGSLSGRSPVKVDALLHDVGEVGDEALLLAQSEAVFIGADRVASAQAAAQFGATFLVLDDGFQSAAFHAPALIVVDAQTGVGNGKILPAGPLRAPLAHQWSLASALLVLGAGDQGLALARQAEDHGLPAFFGRLSADAATAARLRGKTVFAFAGIGRPDKFFATLEDERAVVVGVQRFADHHRYSPQDARTIAAARRAARAELLATTEKDLARLPQGAEARRILEDVLALPVAVKIDQEQAFAAWFTKIYG